MEIIDELKRRLVERVDITNDISDEELMGIISSLVNEKYSRSVVPVSKRLSTVRELFNSIRGLDILQDILEDSSVTEIMINGPDDIFIEREGLLYRYPGSFSSREKLGDIIQTIASRANKRVNESSPILDTRLPDGSRVNIVLRPIALNGPVITIRKFSRSVMSMNDLVRRASITAEASEFLKELVRCGYNIFISGGTGSGKTTFLNALSDHIPKDERIITIEDSAELQLSGLENLVVLECRQANTEGDNEVTMRDLIKASLRMRPSRIIVGEVRGPEALDMLQAMNTGHDGSLSTGHANSPEGMLSRLETMVLTGADMPLDAIKRQISSALDVIVHLERVSGGERMVSEITEVLDMENGAYRLNCLYRLEDGPGRGLCLKKTANSLHNNLKLRRKDGSWREVRVDDSTGSENLVR